MQLGKLLNKSYEILKSASIDTYILDSQLLLAKVLKVEKLFVLLNKDFEVSEAQETKFNDYLEKRKNKMPIKYILGECEFMGLDFIIKEGVLIPRPDTEILVEAAIEIIKEKNLTNIIDLCCGSGAIGLSIAKYCENTKVKCIDISKTALDVTSINIKKIDLNERVIVSEGDLLSSAIEKGYKCQLLASNPPYIKGSEIEELMEDVRCYEPKLALDGGDDGLDFYRKITEQSLSVVTRDGILIYEIGCDQKDEIFKIMSGHGYGDLKCLKDLSGKDRVVLGTLL